MEQFLQALERVEKGEEVPGRQPYLSAKMRDSWKTKQFWFDYGIRKSFDVDAVYGEALHTGSANGFDLLDDKAREEMDLVARLKMEQLESYKEECRARFSSKADDDASNNQE